MKKIISIAVTMLLATQYVGAIEKKYFVRIGDKIEEMPLYSECDWGYNCSVGQIYKSHKKDCKELMEIGYTEIMQCLGENYTTFRDVSAPKMLRITRAYEKAINTCEDYEKYDRRVMYGFALTAAGAAFLAGAAIFAPTVATLTTGAVAMKLAIGAGALVTGLAFSIYNSIKVAQASNVTLKEVYNAFCNSTRF